MTAITSPWTETGAAHAGDDVRPAPTYEVRTSPLAGLEDRTLAAMAALLEASACGHPFQTPAFAEFVNTSDARPPTALLAYREGLLVGYWLGFRVRYRKRLPARDLLMLRSAPIIDGRLVEEERDAVIDRLIASLTSAEGSPGITRIVVTCELVGGELLAEPLRRHGFRASALETFVIDTAASEEELWAAIGGSNRRSIRVSERNGVTVGPAESAADFEAFRAMLAAVLKRGGLSLPLPKDHGRRLQDLTSRLQARLLIARQDGAISGGMLVIASGDIAASYHTAVAKRENRSGDLLMWEAIRTTHSWGCARFDLLSVESDPEPGSHEAGIREFKAKWGGALLPTPVSQLDLPDVAPIRALKTLRSIVRRR